MNLRKFLFAAAALAALPVPAAAQERNMCAALDRIATASRERVPFASLEGHRGELVPGYRYCRVETETPARDGRVLCHTQFAPKTLIAEIVGRQVRDCLGARPVPRAQLQGGLAYRIADLSITVVSNCDERCHVGRIASLSITRRRDGETAPPR